MLRSRSARAVLALVPLAVCWLAPSRAFALTYHISWLEDEGKRAQITAVMNEAVAIYNATTNFNVDVNVIYSSGIPTAQSNYNGELGFGGSISTQVALHEIAHYLGSGTTTQWEDSFNGGTIWARPVVQHFVKFFDGPGGVINRSGVHYFPYGFNYGNEDNPDARLRLPRLIQAMRFDMGGQDSDGDGISDEWERYKIGDLSHTNAGDIDGDGLSTFDEWWTEGNPLQAQPIRNGRIYQIRSKLSQQLVEVENTTAGANVRQNPNNGSDLQKWTVYGVGGGYWKFINLASGKALETINQSTAAGANVIAWNDTGNANQHWRIVPDGTTYSKIFNQNATNMVLDVDGGQNATGNGTNISQYYDVIGGTNQDWEFDDVTPSDVPVSLMAEYKLEGNARDHSGRLFHGTATGGIVYNTGRIDGQCATFNGTTGSIQIPACVDVNFSLACWVKTTATAGNGQWYNGMGLVDAEVPGVSTDFGLAMVGNKAAFGVGKNDFTILSSGAINDGAWHHLAATLNTTTGAMTLYVDGVVQATGTGPTGARLGPGSFRLGSIAGVTGYFNGSMDEVRIYGKILNQTEVSRLATVGNTQVARYGFEGNLQDASNHSNHGDPMFTTYTTGKVGANAIQLNGTNGYVKLPASASMDFTVAFWVKTTVTAGMGQWYQGMSMIDSDVPGIANDWGISLVGAKAGFGMGDAGAGFTLLSTTSINDGTWHHVAMTRVNSSGAMKVYVDGSLQASGTGSTALRNAPHGIRMGSTLFGGTYFNGAIDDLRIFNYALPAPQVASLVAPTLPATWTAADIGNPGSDGYTGYAATGGGVFNTVGGGNISGTSDQFQLISTNASGDRTALVRVTGTAANVDGTANANARTGLMFRDSSAANAPFAAIYLQNGVVRFMGRGTAGGAATVNGSANVAAPCWLKLVRIGNSFSGFYATTTGSPAVTDWMPLYSTTMTMTANALAGITTTSEDPLRASAAVLSDVSVAPPIASDLWRQLSFGSILYTGNFADSADPDQDGVTNIFERAYGTNPLGSTPAADRPSCTKSGADLVLAYTRSLAATDLQYQALWSNNLTSWSETGVIDTLVSTTATTEKREAKIPISTLGGNKGYLRLRVK